MTLAFWLPQSHVRIGDQVIGSTIRPAVTSLPNGGYVAGWLEGSGLKIQIFDGSGNPIGAVTSVDAVGVGGSVQNNLDIESIGEDGRFIVTWNAKDGAGNFDLNTRIFKADLTAGAVSQLADNTTTHFTNVARVAAGSDGRFVSTYMEDTSIRFKVHNADGGVAGSIVLDSGTNIDSPEVTYIGDNKFVVSYGQGDDINFRIIDATDPQTPTALPGELPASAISGTVSEVVGLKDANGALTGQFAVVRHIQNTGQILATFYDQSGDPLDGNGHPVLLTDSAYNGNDFMSVTALRGGRIALAYSGQGPNDNDYVMLAIARSDGTAEAPQKMVVSLEGNQQDPRISEMADGRVVIAWSDPTEPKSAISTVIVDPRNAAVTVNGTTGADIYAGSEYNGNVLNGAGGHDKFIGGSGSDQMSGGADTDTVSYERSGAGVVVDLANKVGAGGFAQADTYTGIENAMGSGHSDILKGDDSNNYLWGLGGNDVLSGGAGADTLSGGSGIDTVDYSGATISVTVNLATGNGSGGFADGDLYSEIENVIGSQFGDILIGNGAANVLYGGKGDDIYYVSAGDVVIENAEEGHDKVITDGNYTLGSHIQDLEGTGGAALTLTGNVHNNTITGNAAGNWIDGGAGADTMKGGGGDDIYVIDNVGDVIIDFEGNNSVVSTVQLNLNNLQGNFSDITVAEGFNFNVDGTSGHNVLKGNAFANTLKGNGGNDKLYGMLGNDKLYGGTGRDTFVFDTRLNKTKNVDKIYDFKSRDDSFHLDNAIFTKLGSGTAARPKMFKSDMFVEGARAKDREDRIVYDKKSGALYYDQDGTGSKVQVKIATISNETKLYYHDFFVI